MKNSRETFFKKMTDETQYKILQFILSSSVSARLSPQGVTVTLCFIKTLQAEDRPEFWFQTTTKINVLTIKNLV